MDVASILVRGFVVTEVCVEAIFRLAGFARVAAESMGLGAHIMCSGVGIGGLAGAFSAAKRGTGGCDLGVGLLVDARKIFWPLRHRIHIPMAVVVPIFGRSTLEGVCFLGRDLGRGWPHRCLAFAGPVGL